MRHEAFERLDMHIRELMGVPTCLAEIDETDRNRLTPGMVTLPYVIRDMLRTAARELVR